MTLVAVALPRVLFDLNSDYGDRFAAFKVHQGVLHELSQWPDFFGALPLVLVIFAGAFLVREVAARRFAIFLGAQTVIIFVTMRQVQDPTPQHFYLYFATFVPILALAIARLRVWPRLLTGVLGFLVSIFVFVAPASVTSFGLLPQVRVIPEQRTDLGEIHRLLQFLDAKLARDPGFIAIIGYTPTMSDTAMAHANLSLSRRYRSPQRILLSSQMDTRDGFPTALLYASLVVVTDPLQCRQPAVDQRVVEIPGKAFLEGRHIARAFVRLPETFALQYGVTAYVFERRRMTTHEELAALSEELRAYYPDRPDVYAPPPDLMGEPALTEGR